MNWSAEWKSCAGIIRIEGFVIGSVQKCLAKCRPVIYHLANFVLWFSWRINISDYPINLYYINGGDGKEIFALYSISMLDFNLIDMQL